MEQIGRGQWVSLSHTSSSWKETLWRAIYDDCEKSQGYTFLYPLSPFYAKPHAVHHVLEKIPVKPVMWFFYPICKTNLGLLSL